MHLQQLWKQFNYSQIEQSAIKYYWNIRDLVNHNFPCAMKYDLAIKVILFQNLKAQKKHAVSDRFDFII